MNEHDDPDCPGDSGGTMCDDGVVWGCCESENCYGACERYGTCACKCHVTITEADHAARQSD